MRKKLTHAEVSSAGGLASAQRLTKEQRIERARKAVEAREEKRRLLAKQKGK